MIKKSEVLCLAEVKKLLEEQEKKLKEQKEEKQEKLESTISYAKKFSELGFSESKKLIDELKKLDLMQLKDRTLVKIADLLPADAEDLYKILAGESVTLEKNEIDKILEIVKKHIR